MALTHLSLFSGIGGIDLAAEWAGFETVGQVEWADYPTKVLEKHWPDVPRWRDIRDVTGEVLPNGITVVSGGFPCQPFSLAGKQKSKEDERYLWPEMCRVIREVSPSWVIGENVRGIVNLALDTVSEDLENLGYSVQSFIIPAIGIGAPHKRERVFIVAHTDEQGLEGRNSGSLQERPCEQPFGKSSSHMAYAYDESKSQASAASSTIRSEWDTWNNARWSSRTSKPRTDWWESEPDVGRVANGVPSRVDRLKCLGNAVVPQQIYPVFKAIANIENGVF